jgi:hypothetical protein
MDDSGVTGTAQLEQFRRERRVKLAGGPRAPHSRGQGAFGLNLQGGTLDGLFRGNQKRSARRTERTYRGPRPKPTRQPPGDASEEARHAGEVVAGKAVASGGEDLGCIAPPGDQLEKRFDLRFFDSAPPASQPVESADLPIDNTAEAQALREDRAWILIREPFLGCVLSLNRL